MYIERLFKKWTQGLIHLGIALMCPIIQIVAYMITQDNFKSESYLHLIIFLTGISFIHGAYLSDEENQLSKALERENLINMISLGIALGISLLLLLICTNNSNSLWLNLWLVEFILLFSPVATCGVEIVRSWIHRKNAVSYEPEKPNIVEGASGV